MPDEPQGHRERLRYRYLSSEGDALTDEEWLELLLTYSVPRRDTKAAAAALLNRFGTLSEVFRADVAELKTVPGIGDSTALFLHLQGDLRRRILRSGLPKRGGAYLLLTPADTAAYAASLFSSGKDEALYLVALDARGVVCGAKKIASGTLSEVTVYPRTVVEQALLFKADRVLLIHNHPAGDPTPSPEDVAFTDRIREALAAVEIPLLDHVIAGSRSVYSMSSASVLRPEE